MDMLSNAEINIVYVKSVRARRLSISIKPFKPVRVTFPVRVSQKRAQEFLQSNIEWVKKAIIKMLTKSGRSISNLVNI